MRVRPATVADAEAIFAIAEASFSTPWSLAAIQADIEETHRTSYWVGESEDGLVGFAAGWCVYGEGEVVNIAVAPAYRQRGYGEQLLQALLESLVARGAEQVFLEVRVSNTPAQTLYTQYGFTTLSVRKGYYADTGEDALVMQWHAEPRSAV